MLVPPCKRLPCRGCTSKCKLYPSCNGKPWRSGLTESSSDNLVVIYGGNGFVGSAIARRFVERDYPVICLSRQGKKPVHLNTKAASWADKVVWLKGDAANPDLKLLDRASTVITTVGSPPLPTFTREKFNRQLHTNGLANIKLLEACSRYRLKNIVIISAQIPDFLQRPGFAYASGKIAVIDRATEIFSDSATAVTIVKPSVVYGLRHTRTGKPVPLGFLKTAGKLLSWLSKLSSFQALSGLENIAPVSVSKIAKLCVTVSSNGYVPDAQPLIIPNKALLEG